MNGRPHQCDQFDISVYSDTWQCNCQKQAIKVIISRIIGIKLQIIYILNALLLMVMGYK